MALYIHIPFCRRKCGYCSFVSYQNREADIPAYLGAIRKELARRTGGERVGSIYFGGGTPSLLAAGQVRDILADIYALFSVDEAAEITLEANPGTVDEAYLAAIRGLGINRLSLGVQSLNDGELGLLGRIHTAAEAGEAVRLARSAGFDNLSLDLIYGLPGQSLESWRRTLAGALEMTPEHLSLYALTLEAGTPLQRAIDAKALPAIDPDLSADQYQLAEDLLAERGYRHYEISNWAIAGRECRHNLAYWQNRPYLGAGVAAHSHLHNHRLANTSSLDEYLAAFSGNTPLSPEMDEAIGPELQMAESVILGLRLDEGIDAVYVNQRFGTDVLAHYRRQFGDMADCGLLEEAGGHVRLTRRGRLLSNEVFWRLLPD
ncbi:MAG: radical SAM family heme chaperone HemW [Chloroflexota bacterium]